MIILRALVSAARPNVSYAVSISSGDHTFGLAVLYADLKASGQDVAEQYALLVGDAGDRLGTKGCRSIPRSLHTAGVAANATHSNGERTLATESLNRLAAPRFR